jgi:hypothetical protein
VFSRVVQSKGPWGGWFAALRPDLATFSTPTTAL